MSESPYKNAEQYIDPTAGKAISEVDKVPLQVSETIRAIKLMADLAGFEVHGRIWLVDKKTGKEYR